MSFKVTSISTTKGQGVICTSPAIIHPGDVIFSDHPLVWQPVTAVSRPRGHCATCSAPLGSLRSRLSLLSGGSLASTEGSHFLFLDNSLLPLWAETGSLLLPETLPHLQEESCHHGSDGMECQGCHEVWFCGDRCREKSNHARICQKVTKEFSRFAATNHPFFGLSIQLVALVLEKWQAARGDYAAAVQDFDSLRQPEFWEVSSPDEGRERLAGKKLEKFKKNVEATVTKAYALIQEVFRGSESFFKDLTRERYSRCGPLLLFLFFCC